VKSRKGLTIGTHFARSGIKIKNRSKEKHMAWLQKFPFLFAVLLVLTLGLAPWSMGFVAQSMGKIPVAPEPHIMEKLRMLMSGALHRPMDIFDLLLHSTPWILLVLKLVSMVLPKAAK
jgi:hypothetical protein